MVDGRLFDRGPKVAALAAFDHHPRLRPYLGPCDIDWPTDCLLVCFGVRLSVLHGVEGAYI